MPPASCPDLDAPAPAPAPADSEDAWGSAAYFGAPMAAAGEGEELTAQDVSGAGFGPDGTADQMHPGPVLAIGYARTVAERLPRCLAALAAGKIHPVHLRIIAEETAFLSAADVARKLPGATRRSGGSRSVPGTPDGSPRAAHR